MWSITAPACSEQVSLSSVSCQLLRRNCAKQQQLFAEQHPRQGFKYLMYYSAFLPSVWEGCSSTVLQAPRLTELRAAFSFPLTPLWAAVCTQRIFVLWCSKWISLLSQKMIYLSSLYLGSSWGFASAVIISSVTTMRFGARRISWLFSNWIFFWLLAPCVLVLCGCL